MRVLLAVTAVVISCVSLGAQVTVSESGICAHLVRGTTTIALPVRNAFQAAVQARVDLKWLSPTNKEDGEATKTLELRPGDSTVEISLPIGVKIEPLQQRLSYQVQPSYPNLTSFDEMRGIVSLANIADYAFTLRVVTPAIVRPGAAFDVQIFAANPVTGQPVSGVTITRADMSAVTDRNGAARLTVTLESDDDLSDEDIEASVGDFRQTAEIHDVSKNQGTTTIQLDKPIYQPGQTMHVRILTFGEDGKAHAGVAKNLKVKNADGDVEFATKLATSAYGIAATDWAIPANAKAGNYTLTADEEEENNRAQREVEIRKYELPSFEVKAHGLRNYYLPGMTATIEVNANYLFGKPLTSGSVRINEGVDDDAEEFAQGALDGNGVYRKSFVVKASPLGGRLFEDRHFVAFVTDATTNRTEQVKFDLRISRQDLHLYQARRAPRADGQSVYVTTYSAGGDAVAADVTALMRGKVLARTKSNRFGVARLDFGLIEGEILIRARMPDGREGTMTTLLRPNSLDESWLSVERKVCAPGEVIRGTIRARRKDFTAHLTAWNAKGAMVFSRAVKVTAGVGDFSIPYAAEFGRVLGIAVVGTGFDGMLTTRVIFPGEDELHLKASSSQKEYAPGEVAHLEFAASSQAALGIAVVDQSVVERAATDAAFGQRGDGLEVQRIGGVGYSELLHMDPRKIDADVELLAEVLLTNPPMVSESYEDAEAEAAKAYQGAFAKSLEPFGKKLDDLYRDQLQYPKELSDYSRVADSGMVDPWLQPYDVRFRVNQSEDVMELWSAGPDKVRGTDDDFLVWEMRRKWFARFESLMGDALKKLEDYPPTEPEFVQRFERAGVHFATLRDPWNSPMRLRVRYERDRRSLIVMSAGPDRKFGTVDDFAVCGFSGTYFTANGKEIQKKVDRSKEFPATERDLFRLAKKAGVDLERVRDPWGRRYYAKASVAETYYDKVSFYSYAEYGRVEETRKKWTPSRHRLLKMDLRSAGPNGRRGTYDDFAVYSFFRVLDDPVKDERDVAVKQKPPSVMPGKGMILGTVTDQIGATVVGVRVTLNDSYSTTTDAAGRYYFADLPRGIYRLQFEMAGFQRGEGGNIPSEPDQLTKFDFMLRVGSASQTVEVDAAAPIIETSAAEVAGLPINGIATPKLREYFPETLYWQPELITDAKGHASADVKLADTITNWRVSVTASTIDGQVTETEMDVRAFQPFQVDLDVPPVLTVGDQITLPVPIRNYTDIRQQVSVKAAAFAGLVVGEGAERAYAVGKTSSTQAAVSLRADAPSEKAKLQVSAVGGSASDAIAKTTVIHPDGEPMSQSVTGVLRGEEYLQIAIGAHALPGSAKGEVKIYPTFLARLFESVEALLQRPWGCGEQTISSTYPNLLILQALKQAAIHDQQIEDKARKNLQLGYVRLLSYQADDGGFQYWHKGTTDVALTGYALRFLREAREFLEVDEERVKKAEMWLARQPSVGGTVGDSVTLDRLTKLAKGAAEYSDPYDMAAFVLAAIEMGKRELATSTVARLRAMAQDEQGAAYWDLRANTPFHGWGRTGQVETTAVVISALAKWGTPDLKPLIDRGILFLLRNSDRQGVWGSGQATVRALMAMLATASSKDYKERTVDVMVNGTVAQTVTMRADLAMRGPIVLDISKLLRPGVNEISQRSHNGVPIQAQFNAEWYEHWAGPRLARDFALTTKFSSTAAKVNAPVKCAVTVSRPEFRGYGMMIAEVGLPPGAEVDLGSLEATLAKIDSYEVAPDHVTFYVWPQAKDVQFEFLFRPRFAMKARMAESVLYDYYNPDARTVLVPDEFTAR